MRDIGQDSRRVEEIKNYFLKLELSESAYKEQLSWNHSPKTALPQVCFH